MFGVLRNPSLLTATRSFFVGGDLVELPSTRRVIAGHKYECPLVLARPLPMAKQE
jgi:hypothetical protein